MKVDFFLHKGKKIKVGKRTDSSAEYFFGNNEEIISTKDRVFCVDKWVDPRSVCLIKKNNGTYFFYSDSCIPCVTSEHVLIKEKVNTIDKTKFVSSKKFLCFFEIGLKKASTYCIRAGVNKQTPESLKNILFSSKFSKAFYYKPEYKIANLELISSFLNKRTFGVEIEGHFKGISSYKRSLMYDVRLVNDGSLRKDDYDSHLGELVTNPIKGVEGMVMLHSVMDNLFKSPGSNSSCATHVHIDVNDFSKSQIVALYILMYKLQEEILDSLPHYISDPVSIARKGKNYSERLLPLRGKEVEEYYDFIKVLFTAQDPKDVLTKPKWGPSYNSHTRYKILNLVPFFFGKETAEFRPFYGSFSEDDVFTWVLTSLAIVDHAKEHTEEVIESYQKGFKIKLEQVLSVYTSKVRMELVRWWIDNREEKLKRYYDAVTKTNSGTGNFNSTLMHLTKQCFTKKQSKFWLKKTNTVPSQKTALEVNLRKEPMPS